jgi:hypothetical protein
MYKGLLPTLIGKLSLHKVGSRPLHSLLCLEFIKHLDQFSLLEKANIMLHLARIDIDASAILKTAHRVLSATLIARENEEFPDGIYDS